MPATLCWHNSSPSYLYKIIRHYLILGMVLVMFLLLAKKIMTLYHTVKKSLTVDQHTPISHSH
ncbi:hypothetical protein CWO17_21575 [Vibrio sp. 10N.286.45.A3]|nr:hypothetical protein CWO17_21575 [Vibrio sp. 10N.286.45.A3]TKE81174.1 hypothetical protein FCV56_14300 [Vibrio sp. F12]TKE87534.1 hypothetical protein FCV53_23900 [Vibrio sp. F12]TKE90796.1 hypothetical protein FCV61_23205 [Vibrio sp. F12]